jgi:hypothetical protein
VERQSKTPVKGYRARETTMTGVRLSRQCLTHLRTRYTLDVPPMCGLQGLNSPAWMLRRCQLTVMLTRIRDHGGLDCCEVHGGGCSLLLG